MKIMFICNSGGGFADVVEVAAGMTAEAFFKARMGTGKKPADYLVRVNRKIVSAKEKLHDGDRVTITPTKIRGAA